MNLSDKNILITGAAKRVGREIALALAPLSKCVVIHYHDSEQDAKALCHDITSMGYNAHLAYADLKNSDDIYKMAEYVNCDIGPIDVLINSAALFYKTSIDSMTEDEWDDMIKVNLTAPFLCSKLFGNDMKKRGCGRIINIACVGGVIPWKNYIAYNVSKAGLIMLTKVLAKSLAPDVLVNAILPGTILPPDSNGGAIHESPLRGSPQDIVNAIKYLLIDGDFVTGTLLTVDGGRSIM